MNIDGKSYHLDVTWDISVRSASTDRISYDYFNLSDFLIGKEHQVEMKLPVCRSMRDNYFQKCKRVFWRKNQVLRYVEKQMKKGEKEIYFRVEGIHKASDIVPAVYLVTNVPQDMAEICDNLLDMVEREKDIKHTQRK